MNFESCEEFIQMNPSIKTIIDRNMANSMDDGTIIFKQTNKITHYLNEGRMYWVFMIDRMGFPNRIGPYVYEGIDNNQYVMKCVEWGMNTKYNMLLLPFIMADRFLFESTLGIGTEMTD